MQYDAIVIGGGLFGCITTRKLRSEGRSVLLIDKCHLIAGSKPAACLIKPGWLNGFGKPEVIEQGMVALDDLYGTKDLTFKIGPLKTNIHWVDPKQILSEEKIYGDVVKVTLDGTVILSTGETFTANTVIAATGIWANEILPMEAKIQNLSNKDGVAFTWQGKVDPPEIMPWAPYRQLIKFNRADDEIWISDGTSNSHLLSNVPASMAIFERMKNRCQKFSGRIDLPKIVAGSRPYIKMDEKVYIKRVSNALWVINGGAKNGTFGAIHCSLIIEKETA